MTSNDRKIVTNKFFEFLFLFLEFQPMVLIGFWYRWGSKYNEDIHIYIHIYLISKENIQNNQIHKLQASIKS